MPHKSKPIKLWEWGNQAGEDTSSSAKTSLSHPEDAQQSGTTLIPVVGKSFLKDNVIIDGRNFINCDFSNCNIQWNGNDFIFTTCTFQGTLKLVSPMPEVATSLKLAGICGLLDESTHSSETVLQNKGKTE